MLLQRRLISFLVLLSAACLSGCHTTQAHSASSASTALKAPAPHAALPAATHPPRDSALSIYSNPAYGLSFRYPRTYLLDDPSDSESDSILAAQEQLAADQPGAVLLALITIPPDAYPNTTFLSGSLLLVVNPAPTRESCQALAAPDDETSRSGVASTQSLIFHWRQKLSATSSIAAASAGVSGASAIHRDYAAFSNATCYEFSLDVLTAPIPAADPQPPGNANLPFGASSNPANPPVAPKIFRHLEKIISSLQTHPPVPTTPPKSL
jgi:hypothetical protein